MTGQPEREGGTDMPEARYDAFISYSHKDMRWGRWVQKRLERFRLPRPLRSESSGRSTNLRVFRDQTDLAGVELQATLQRELEASRFLIVICSPHSAASPWVNEEVRYFKSIGGTDRIVPFIVAGEPESDDPAAECYPEELRNEQEHHFMGANIREIGKNKALLRVLSVLLDIRFDRLSDRVRKRKLRTAAIATAACVLAAAAAGAILWRDAAIARENERMIQGWFWSYVPGINIDDAEEKISPEVLAAIEASANEGNRDAMALLGLLNVKGKASGTEDPEEAFRWYLRGAEAGSPGCMYVTGNNYLNGYGTEPDEAASFEWCLKAAQAGDADSMAQVGVMLAFGIGTEKDEAEATKWYERSAEAGNVTAMDQLYHIYYNAAADQPENAGKAFFWAKRAAESGDTKSMVSLGLLYQMGFGVEENQREAYLWYRRAAEAGDANGMFLTALCLEYHYGVDSEAEEWYLRAAALGQEGAIERLRQGEDGPGGPSSEEAS